MLIYEEPKKKSIYEMRKGDVIRCELDNKDNNVQMTISSITLSKFGIDRSGKKVATMCIEYFQLNGTKKAYRKIEFNSLDDIEFTVYGEDNSK